MRRALVIVADENIPHAGEAFGTLGAVRRMPGRAMTPADARAADVLLVRSVTPVGAGLLAGSRVRFVGSATIGTDHVDTGYLRREGIAFAHAPGANAGSVVEYVLAALLHLSAGRGEALRGKTVGVVGCGNIGGRLAGRLPALGAHVLQNDPPCAEAAARPHVFAPLEHVLAAADVVTLHVPLAVDGPHPTHHLINEKTLCRMKPGAWLLNTARGPVVDNVALRHVLSDGVLGAAVLDVWEHEPAPDPALIRAVDLATPHIAGYSFDGKLRGTLMLYEALCAHLNAPPAWDYEAAIAPQPGDRLALTPPDPALSETDWLHALTRQMYDLAADDARLRKLPALPPEERGAYFSGLRKHYPRRRAFERYTLPAGAVPEAYRAAVDKGLRVNVNG